MPDTQHLKDLVIILDLDGTLVDSAPDLAAAMNVVLAAEGLAEIPEQDVRHLVGHGARALLTKGLELHGRTEVPEDQMQAYIDRFIDYYKDHLADRSKPFPGVPEALNALQSKGAALAVCTNKRGELTFPLLKALNLDSWFQCIICRDSLPVYKPDPLPLRTCVERTRSSRGIMVGDTTTDLKAALAAEMPCLIASFGYGNFSDADMKKARRFDHFEELPGLIKEIDSAA